MLATITKAVVIGVAASIPIGPIAMLVLQRSFNGGHKAGMLCAAGAIITDTIYALISVFAFSAIAGFFDKHTTAIEFLGGLVIIMVGISMMLSKPPQITKPLSSSEVAMDVTKSTLMGLSNPGAFAWMLGLFATLGVDVHSMPWYMTTVTVLCVCAGTVLYWLIFTYIAAKGKGSFKPKTLQRINQVFGAVVGIFGLVFVVRGVISII